MDQYVRPEEVGRVCLDELVCTRVVFSGISKSFTLSGFGYPGSSSLFRVSKDPNVKVSEIQNIKYMVNALVKFLFQFCKTIQDSHWT